MNIIIEILYKYSNKLTSIWIYEHFTDLAKFSFITPGFTFVNRSNVQKFVCDFKISENAPS